MKESKEWARGKGSVLREEEAEGKGKECVLKKPDRRSHQERKFGIEVPLRGLKEIPDFKKAMLIRGLHGEIQHQLNPHYTSAGKDQ